jgi:hypothetical protein
MIYVPVAALNRDIRIWGPDAAEFKYALHSLAFIVDLFELNYVCRPDRWDAIPEGASTIPGVWAHLFSFLGGPHNCIGWRFSLAECVQIPCLLGHWHADNNLFDRMKSLLYTLIRTFEFELAVKPEDIFTGTTAVQRPILVNEPKKGPQLPMRLRKVQA